MKVLIDECAPKALKVALAARGFDCTTVLARSRKVRKSFRVRSPASRRSAPILPTPLRSSYEAQTENDFAIVFIGSKSLSLSSGSSMKPYFR
jgi:hypothetical protein